MSQASNEPSPPTRPYLGRRGFIGLAIGAAVGASTARLVPTASAQPSSAVANASPSFHGMHQAGIVDPPQARVQVVAFQLDAGVNADSIGRLLRTWTGTIAAVMAGRPAPGDAQPTLASGESGLTVTIGVGPRVLRLASADSIDLTIPRYPIDDLQDRWSGGDLVAQICADDSTTIAHASRQLMRDAAPFAQVSWTQNGFSGIRPDGVHRNLFGHIEGQGNLVPTGPEDDRLWITDPQDALYGATTMVVRRIAMDLDTWQELAPVEQEQAIGRRLSDGGVRGHSAQPAAIDFDLLDTETQTHRHSPDESSPHDHQPVGLAIPENAHMRRAHPAFNDNQVLFRRGYSYQDDNGESGLIFISFQSQIAAFTTVQDSLAASDALNAWTTPIGSAAFVILPGCPESTSWLGESLFTA